MSEPGEHWAGTTEDLAFIRDQTRFELGLLHDRVNALVAAESFLAIAFTTAMGNATAWGVSFARVVSPVLAVLGLLLALLAWPGIDATVRIILRWTARQDALLARHTALGSTRWGQAAQGRDSRGDGPDQRRSMLFFRAVPGLFVLVWLALTVVALVLPR